MGRKRKDEVGWSDFVYRSLRVQILSGRLAPDTPVAELVVATRYAVGRAMALESLGRLEAEGLLYAHPTRGLIVRAPEHGRIEDILVVRQVLDALSTRLAARRISDTGIRQLRLIQDSMEEGAKTGDAHQVMVANTMFHDAIYDAAGNSTLQRVARDLHEYVVQYSTLPFSNPDRIARVLAEHTEIVDALDKGEIDRAVRASDCHLAGARDYLVQIQQRRLADQALRQAG